MGDAVSCAMSAATTCTSSRKRPPCGLASAASRRLRCTRPTTTCPNGRRRAIHRWPAATPTGRSGCTSPSRSPSWAVRRRERKPSRRGHGPRPPASADFGRQLDIRHQACDRPHATERRSAFVSIRPCVDVVRDGDGAAGAFRLEGRRPGLRGGGLYRRVARGRQRALGERRRLRRRRRAGIRTHSHNPSARDARVAWRRSRSPGGGGVLVTALW